eukprot:279699_1
MLSSTSFLLTLHRTLMQLSLLNEFLHVSFRLRSITVITGLLIMTHPAFTNPSPTNTNENMQKAGEIVSAQCSDRNHWMKMALITISHCRHLGPWRYDASRYKNETHQITQCNPAVINQCLMTNECTDSPICFRQITFIWFCLLYFYAVISSAQPLHYLFLFCCCC